MKVIPRSRARSAPASLPLAALGVVAALVGAGCVPDLGRCACPEGMTCRAGSCVATNRCEDGLRDGDETDLDCGGGCRPCSDGRSCRLDRDCRSDLCRSHACTSPPAFALREQHPLDATKGVFDLAAGDLRHDGAADLWLGDGRGVTYFRNTRTGDFDAAGSRALGDSISGLGLADFDGDGKLDLVFTDLAAPSASVLHGNGDGSFRLATTSSGPPITTMATADFNGDGRLDVVTAWKDLAVRLGQGDGGFQGALEYFQGHAAARVAAADLDGDGKADMVSFGPDDNYVSVLYGRGDGSFESARAYGSFANVGGALADVAVRDFDGDGRIDIAVLESRPPQATVLLQTAPRVFSSSGAPASVRANPVSIATGDWNSDGRADLAAASDTTSLLVGDGHGAFPGSAIGIPLAPPIVTADVDGDGIDDLVGPALGSSLAVVLGRRDAMFAPPRALITLVPPSHLVAGDWDASGRASLAGAIDGDPHLYVFSIGRNVTATATHYLVGASSSLVTGDFDRDGHLDLLVAVEDGLAFLSGDGRGGFHGAPPQYPLSTGPVASVIADLDGDGALDLAFAEAPPRPSNGTPAVDVLLGDGRGGFRPQPRIALDGPPTSIAAADVNGDGLKDLLVAVPDKGVVVPLLGVGGGRFAQVESIPGDRPSAVIAADVSGDGIADLLMAQASSLGWLAGDGHGGFAVGQLLLVPGAPSAMALDDFDGDGHPDLVVSSSFDANGSSQPSPALVVFLGVGDGFAAGINYDAPVHASKIIAADLNRDHKPDLVLFDQTGFYSLLNVFP